MIVLNLSTIMTALYVYFECIFKEILNSPLKKSRKLPRITPSMLGVHLGMSTPWIGAIFTEVAWLYSSKVTATSPMSLMAPSYQA